MKRSVRRVAATEVKTHFGRIVQDVAATGTTIIIQTRGQDQAAIISLQDLDRLLPSQEGSPRSERERVRDALRSAGMLRELPQEVRERAADYDARHSPIEQERILRELRGLKLEPPLSEVIIESRNGPYAELADKE
ncbi:MAG: type II toxin-antitoxin system Phd/YefM family antitoxin [Chloroflexi bacterium]|nr:type II toxin-antitoxin system Phd/YefM family antitoxin [Chloroflexota bacterium]